ncbi:MAG: UDP-N-acetylmuramate--L-alanine ligase [Zetaproteobacteria bacterium]|nr:MAG: UDP-N-acetylmuramate--L-alanine ligase [Zetaproteobacteria bacterium]
MRTMSPDIGTLHFVGIGGIGMSGIAALLLSLGYDVQGSDIAESANVIRLRKQGARVVIGHKADNIRNKDGVLPAAIVISSAVHDDNVELIAARGAKVPVVQRAEMLAELMRLKSSVAVAGTHGKTTTTSMVGQMLDQAGLDPTVVNGGIVNAYGTNTRFGQSDWMVVEADESDGSFIRLPATVAVVTNIDPEHMDHYKTFDRVKQAYKRFVLNLPFHGYALLCIDHPEVQSLAAQVSDRKVITYGLNPQADIRAENIRPGAEGSIFDVVFAGWLSADGQDQVIKDIHLSMPGEHNVQNSLVALGVAKEMGVDTDKMKSAMSNFGGVKRRFTKTGVVEGITIIDDYAHHPVEIEVVLKTARAAVKEGDGNVIAVMQPHRYSRLEDLYEEFCRCFNDADHVIIMDVFAAGEEAIEGVDNVSFVEGLKTHGHRSAQALLDLEDLPSILAGLAKTGDYILMMGAGNITAASYDLPDQLHAEIQKTQGAVA